MKTHHGKLHYTWLATTKAVHYNPVWAEKPDLIQVCLNNEQYHYAKKRGLLLTTPEKRQQAAEHLGCGTWSAMQVVYLHNTPLYEVMQSIL